MFRTELLCREFDPFQLQEIFPEAEVALHHCNMNIVSWAFVDSPLETVI